MESHQNTNSVEYWKDKAKSYEQKANDIQQELDDYTENSAQLERELDATVLQLEKQNRDLEHQNKRLENEVESLKNKLERMLHENNTLEKELTALQVQKDKQNEYVRELEQKNDDLERGHRVVKETVTDIELLLNQAYERNAVLESEMDEKETLKIELQRISDEARDLKQEIKVKDRIPSNKKEDDTANENISMNGHVHNATTTHVVDTETQYIPTTPQKREVNGNAMTPSSRVSALNIVGDLLRKVGLEKFLCRECGRVKCTCDPPPTTPKSIRSDPESSCFGYNGSLANQNAEDVIEYRNNRLSRLSNPDVNAQSDIRNNLSQRNSEQPFNRFGDNGKLRKSFAIRSREGIENLFSFSTFKKSGDAERLKVKSRQGVDN